MLELVLLVLACALNTGAIALVQFGVLGALDPKALWLSATVSVLLLALHVTLRAVAPGADPLIIPVAGVLNGIGIAEIYRIDLAIGSSGPQSTSAKQIAWTALGIVAAIVILIVIRNHRILLRFTYLSGVVGVVLLVLPLIPGLGEPIGGAQVWIRVGPFSFQPGELAKLALAVFFAGYLVRNRDTLSMVGKRVLGVALPRSRDFGPLLVFWLLAMSVLVFQRDLGTSLLFFGLFLVMLYAATGRASWVAFGLSLFLGGALFAASQLSYVANRFTNWLHPFDEGVYEKSPGGSLQLVQGLFGLAHGGITGTGLGQGYPQVTPRPQSDYIFASIGEELGLTGVFVLLSLYLILVGRGFRIGFASSDDFGKLLAIGLSFLLALQVFIVIGGVTRVIPLTGLTAPFLASGGSSLLSNWMLVAVLLRLSDTIRNQTKLVIE